MLGEFEYFVLAAATRLGDSGYGAAIRTELQEGLDRACSIGALYTTLDRLEQKGLIETRFGEPTAERGGRAKRLVRVTRAGRLEATAFYNAVTTISHGTGWTRSPRSAKP